MIHFQSVVLRILPLVMAVCPVLLCDLGVTSVCGQDPPSPSSSTPAFSEAERARRLAEAKRYKDESLKLANSGKLDEAVAATERKLAIERAVLGAGHGEVVSSLDFLAQLHELRGDWSKAMAARKQVLAIRQRRPDRKEWQVDDARRALEDLERRAAMDPERRLRLRRADALNRAVVAQIQQGKYAAAEMAALEAVRIRREILGERHPAYATSLHNLALLYENMGDYARAEPLYRQALEITKQTLGERHPDYATTLSGLAVLYMAMGDYVRAETLLRQDLQITTESQESNVRPDPPRLYSQA
jgi:tetratricopeptide (TPR) repeat protein